MPYIVFFKELTPAGPEQALCGKDTSFCSGQGLLETASPVDHPLPVHETAPKQQAAPNNTDAGPDGDHLRIIVQQVEEQTPRQENQKAKQATELSTLHSNSLW